MRDETQAAIEAVRLAQGIAESRVGADRITSKGGIDFVTETDIACEDAIRSQLRRSFPEVPVVGEERKGVPIEGRPYWLVDPICGTAHFASGLPLYCTNIALVERQAVVAAAIGIGKTGEILYAEKRRGAWMRTSSGDRQLTANDSSNTLWIYSDTEPGANVMRRALTLDRWYVCTFSSTVAFAHLAAGRMSGILHFAIPKHQPYGSVHSAAGCFVAEEAGAEVRDLVTGKRWTLETRSFLVAASPKVRLELEELVRSG
jgi:myo-inositol-1(or 4)-monophosphatase